MAPVRKHVKTTTTTSTHPGGKAAIYKKRRGGLPTVTLPASTVIPGVTRQVGYYGRYDQQQMARELKFHDIDVNQTAADLSGGVILNTSSINLIAQGTSESERIGRKCTVRNINWRGTLTLIGASTIGTNAIVRLILVLDKQCNGAAPTVLGVLESANYQSFNNLSNKGRFQTLSDQQYVLNPQASAGNGTANDSAPVNLQFACYKKVGIDLEFDSTTGAITEIRSNNLFILAISAASTANFTLDSKVRLRFEG